MEAAFLKLLNMSISAGWLVLAIVLLRIVLKKAPKWMRCILWGMVAVRLICPFSVESVFCLIPSVETVPPEILYAQKPAIHTGVEIVNNVVNPVISESLAPGMGDSVNPLQVLTFLASRIWIIGMLVMAVYAFLSYLQLRRKVAISMPVTENIYLCDDIDTPFILGIVRPRIYLPSIVGQEQVPYVISHERAHLKRGDHLWKPLGYALLTVYWFQPLVWVAYVLLCRDIELACDEKVIRELGGAEKKFYSDALLECSVSHRMVLACPLAFGEVGVKERVKTVLSYKRPAFWVLVIAVVACIAVAVCFLTNPKENREPSPLGRYYGIETTAYTYGREMILSVMHPIDYARYKFTSEGEMQARKGVGLSQEDESWMPLGRLQEVRLTEKNFDSYFKEWQGLPGYPLDLEPEKYRRENEVAWQLLLTGEGEMSYYLLQQKSGDVYLVCWYYDSEHAEDSIVRWMFKLAQVEEEAEEPVVSGEISGLDELRQEQLDLPEPSEDIVGSGDSDTVLPEADAEATDYLEKAIHEAILGTDAEKTVEGVRLVCESHIIMGKETLCGVPKADGTGGGEWIIVYAMVLEQDYVFGEPHGRIVDDGGSHMPVAMTFKREGDNYILEEYWRPQDGSYYESSIRERFPDDIEEEAMDTQKFILAQIQDCYQQAITFAGTDTNGVIEALMEEILSSPLSSSDVQDYISAHYLEYRELTYYGMHTLAYCRDRFEEGNQSDLRGALMAAISQEIARGYGWNRITDKVYRDAQQWYDGYGKEWIFVPLGLAKESSKMDWGITLSAENVTADGLELTITQSGGSPTGDLQFGSAFYLMVKQGDVWKMVPVIIDNGAWTMEARTLSMESSVTFAVDWAWLHGTLPAGTYRLIKEIDDFRGTGNFDTQAYYVEFEIE